MKMSQKMIVLFSLFAILTTALNSAFFYRSKMEDLDERTYDNLNTLGTRIVMEIEQYVQLMDYAIESLTANIDFMNALYTASMQDDESDLGEVLAMQNAMSRTLYQEPILENFYRVSVYCDNGFFISNRFEKTDSVVSMSDEVREIIDSLPYLEQASTGAFRRILVGPHGDPWTTNRIVPVFSAVRPVTWHGKTVGYIEINAHCDDLVNIFMFENMEGFMTQAILANGEELFRYRGDDITYTGLNATGVTRVALPDGSERLVVALRSHALDINIFVSQDMSVYNEQAQELLRRNITTALIMLPFIVLLVTIFSLGLTRAIRQLTKKVRNMKIDNLTMQPDEAITTMVTKRSDQEIFQLEQVFNDLMTRLHTFTVNEIAMREGTLHAQLHALQMQINPHFIYNTLNIISAKGMESGNEEIIDICNQFAQMLRYATDLRSKTATLGEELQNVRHYLLLSKARYEDQLEYTIDVPPEMDALTVPKLTLQPIVENALTHGFAVHTGKRSVSITGELEASTLRLTIRDNGSGFDKEMLAHLRASFRKIEQERVPESDAAGEHLGLINTYLRLYYYSNGNIRMQLYNDGGAIIVITLPQEQEGYHV